MIKSYQKLLGFKVLRLENNDKKVYFILETASVRKLTCVSALYPNYATVKLFDSALLDLINWIMYGTSVHSSCVPAICATVKRVFSQSGLLFRPHRARLSSDSLSMLVYLKCNKNSV